MPGGTFPTLLEHYTRDVMGNMWSWNLQKIQGVYTMITKKKTFSVVLLGMVDYNYNFIFVDLGRQGRKSDGGVFRNCSLNRALNNGSLCLPVNLCLEEKCLYHI